MNISINILSHEEKDMRWRWACRDYMRLREMSGRMGDIR